MLYLLAGVVIVVGGTALVVGLAAMMIAGSCSEAERAQERLDAQHWGSE